MSAVWSIPSEQFAALRPEDVQLYLRSRGWQPDPDATTDKAVVYRYPNEPDAEAIVPKSRELGDYAARLADVAGMLAAVEQRSLGQIVSDISGPPADILRLGIVESNATLGNLPLDEGIRLITGGRDLLLAAACSAHSPQPYYPRQSFKDAVEFVESCRLGQTERGSFVTKFIAPVPALVDRQRSFLDDEEVDVPQEPFARRSTIRLMEALSYVGDALETGAPEKILEGVPRGVSANLCDAIKAMQPSGEQASLRIGISWSASRPRVPPALPPRVTFSQSSSGVLGEVSQQLRKRTTPQVDRVQGYVVELRADATLFEGFVGTVHLKADIGGKTARVKLMLSDKDQYVKACGAHTQGKPVSAAGVLQRGAKMYELREPRDFRVLDNP